MRRTVSLSVLLLILAGIIAVFSFRAASVRLFAQAARTVSQTQAGSAIFGPVAPTSYVYYTLKQSSGFVLARAQKGADGQPLSMPQPIASFSEGFGQLESDSVVSMQLSPDGDYLAIDGSRDHGEQVWVCNTLTMKMSLLPASVMGNFLHWLPGGTGHAFLYRPMFPLGPNAPMDGGVWNPGLWIVDASTGTHKNINIHVPSAFLADAAPSPDGTHIIYSTTAGLGLGSDTWLMNSDGSNLSHLFHNAGGAQSIAGLFTWSPDGSSIAYEQISDSSTPFLPAGLWVMNAHGQQLRRLADTDGGHGYAPVWSPDSHKIAFVVRVNTGDRQANLNAQALQSAIGVVDVASSHFWLVASPAQTGVQLNLNPAWNVNSTGLTFMASNPANLVLGGTIRYWHTSVSSTMLHPAVLPLSSAISHVVAATQEVA